MDGYKDISFVLLLLSNSVLLRGDSIHKNSADISGQNQISKDIYTSIYKELFGVDKYTLVFECYGVILKDHGSSYHSMCTAREQFQVCKEAITNAYPKSFIDSCLDLGAHGSEMVADYFCTKENGSKLWAEYLKCPFRFNFMPLLKDFSPKLTINHDRVKMALSILLLTGHAGFSRWKPMVIYSDPNDVMYQTLYSMLCTIYREHAYHSEKVVGRYCRGEVADMVFEMGMSLEKYVHINNTGLKEWSKDNCVQYEDIDALKRVLSFSDLPRFLKTNVDVGQSMCHPYNMLVQGVSCLMLFHSHGPPFSDVHLIIPSLCKDVKHLKSCWSPIKNACSGNLNHFLSNITDFYNLICILHKELELESIINYWSSLFVKSSFCQSSMLSWYYSFFGNEEDLVLGRNADPKRQFRMELMMQTLDCLMASLRQVLAQRNTSI